MIISTERAQHKAISREQMMSSSLEGLENSHRYAYFLREASVTEGIEGDRKYVKRLCE
jgi:hypothetical protein